MPMTLNPSMTATMRVEGLGCSLDLGVEAPTDAAGWEFAETTGAVTDEVGEAPRDGETGPGAGEAEATNEVCVVVAGAAFDLTGSVLASEAAGAGVGLL